MNSRGKGKRVALLLAAVVAVGLFVFIWFFWQRAHAWYVFWRRFERLGLNAEGHLEYRHRRTGLVMVRVPGGTFWMGAQRTDPAGRNYYQRAAEDESPVHLVTISPFLIGKHEVTQTEWLQLMGGNPSRFRGGSRPVDSVSWGECQSFCELAGLRLPTEAQWECACRGAGEEAPSDDDRLAERAWFVANSRQRPHHVGDRQPNALGLHDMLGNVWEWCEDSYRKDFYSTPAARSPDPVCADSGDLRVYRGGSWASFATGCRPAYRFREARGIGTANVGLRAAYWPLP